MPTVRLAPLLERWVDDPAFVELLDGLETDKGARADVGARPVVVADVARPFLLAGLARATGRLVVVVTATAADAEALVEDVGAFLGPDAADVFPPWETLPHERLSPRGETVGRRLRLLYQLAHPGDGPALEVLAVPARALMQPLAPGLDRIQPVRVAKGDEIDLDELLQRLIDTGYRRTDMVERRGEVAVRGGLVDFFPPGEDHPVRVELWGDEVDSVRSFAVASQRSLAELPGVEAFPCREVTLTDAERARARQLAPEFPAVGDLLAQVAEGLEVDGIECLLPVLFDELPVLPDYLPADAVLAVLDPKRTHDRSEEVRAQADEAMAASWVNAAEGGRTPVEGAAYLPLDGVLLHALRSRPGRALLEVGPFAEGPGLTPVTIDAHPVGPYRADVARIAEDARQLSAAGHLVLMVTDGPGPAERLADVLGEAGLTAPQVPELPAGAKGVLIGTAPVLNGFRLPALGLALLAEGDLYGTRRQTREQSRLPTSRRVRSAGGGGQVNIDELEPGDVVVHAVHGVGRYVGMEHREVGGAERDYLLLAYDQGDRLYLPSEQVEMITRYVGGEAPKLSRLGTKEWDRHKARVRKKVREMAAELVRLYSARMSSPGHAFAPDAPWQRELEDAFPFAETPDQLRAIEEVKADMEAAVPMDRLLCGDVGYGKTEVAVRAAFKAVMDGKQVAILVPTTLLAQQHLATLTERFAPFPIQIGALSRFQSKTEQDEVVAAMANGTIDVVVGTHRLLSADAKWADLGLAIIDEEHRFGVTHKEHLKQLRTQVDVLTLTATPIPRTLEMAVSGIRDLSVMETPPEERHPVLTFVGPHDDTQIANAIRREMVREGQTFYVHNRVDSIGRVAARLRELVPEARVGVAHGQMGEEQLERVMLEFWDKAYDVLLCTTIIESGIDIPTANTLIVDRADTLGLAQLYQLRGRVGRSRERAYAYMMYPRERTMTETAHQRLATIATHTDLGSGMAIAMKDLEIRGAGNLLGGDQSGHVALVGYDMYVSMLADAVAEMRGQPTEERAELKLEVPVDAHIPTAYIPRERLRLEAYRRLGGARTVEDVTALAAELADRYGPPPDPVRNLLVLAGVRAQANGLGLGEVVCFGGRVRLTPVDELLDSRKVRLDRLYRGALLKPAERALLVPLPKSQGPGQGVPQDLPAWLAELLSGILGAPEVPLPALAPAGPRRAAS
jgi:transcription-repair coupling factor (superfamily II helicase)